MANAFDPYRDALVVEQRTIWPDEYADWDESKRQAVERSLHASPQEASQLDYEQLHTGFCRTIIVSAEDIGRLT